MLKHVKKLIFVALLCLWVSPVLALLDCPDVVQTALTATDETCDAATGRNQACYGNNQLSAVPQPGVADFNFDAPGEVVDVAGVQTLTLSSMDTASQQWGVALMRLQANLPDTLPGQNVTFLLFGDVEIESAVSNTDPVTLDITAAGDANVRSGPSTDAAVVASLDAGQIVVADGRLEDNTWLRILLPDGSEGWVFAELVTPSGDITTLNFVDPGAAPQAPVNPMQAFYFRSGIGDTPCEEAPNGLLIQTPVGGPRISLSVNGVSLTLGSTAFLQAPVSGSSEMTVSTLAGVVEVSSGGVTQTSIQGTQVGVPLDQSGVASGAPSAPEPYDGSLLMPLVDSIVDGSDLLTPLVDDDSALLTPLIEDGLLIELTEAQPVVPLTADQIANYGDYLSRLAPHISGGLWRQTYTQPVITGQCYEGMAGGDNGGGVDIPPVPLCQSADGSLLFVQNSPYALSAPGVYAREYSSRELMFEDGRSVGSYTSTSRWELHVISPERVEQVYTSQEEGGCSITMTIVYELVEAGDSICVETVNITPEPPAPPVPPVVEGEYTLTLGALPAECTAENSPPFSGSVTLTYDADGNLILDYGTGTYTLYANGSGFYTYQEQFNGFFQIQVYAVGDYLNLSWSKYGGDGSCYANGEMRVEGSEAISTPIAAPTEAVATAQEAAIPLTDGSYALSWTVMPGYCADEFVDDVPTFTEATLITSADGTITLDYGAGTYTLTSYQGAYGSLQPLDDGSYITMGFSVNTPGSMTGVWMTTTADGSSSCMVTIELILAE